jgi:Tol biopolymer transport system component
MKWKKIVWIGVGLLFFTGQLSAQYFGRNKPHYESFDFKVYQTPTFEIYHYLENEQVLDRFAQFSEQWYQLHQNILRDTFSSKNPMIIYNDHADFQQTNAIMGGVGVGTGGVTEAFKNRVIMPFAMTNQQTFHVLGHELVHAFQYDIVINGDSTSLQNIANLPLWLVEGLAEYMSIGRVDAHTAMWMRSAVINNDVPTLKDLNNPRYFPYRYGQAFWAFLTGLKGDDVIRPFYEATAKYGFEQACRGVVGMSADNLSALWVNAIKQHFGQYITGYTMPSEEVASSSPDKRSKKKKKDKDKNKKPLNIKEDFIGRKMLANEKQSGRINIAPVISPNGRYAIFLSERNLFSIDLFLADISKKEIIREVASSSKSSHIDDFDYIESAGTWSPNSKEFAFVGYKKGQNILIIKEALTGKTVDEIKIPGVPAFSNPAWSPNGDQIVVSGLVQGQADLYSYNLKTKKTTQLTNDIYSELHPSWSADGLSLLFSSDKLSMENGRTNGKWTFNLAILDVVSGTDEHINVFPGADNLNPWQDANGNIVFLSNRDGFRNMYRYDPATGQVFKMTDFMTGISGITHYAPAISLSRRQQRILYTYYNNNQYAVYKGDYDEFLSEEVDPAEVDFAPATLPQINKQAPMMVDRQLRNLDESFEENQSVLGIFQRRDYKAQFKLDYIGGGAGVGVTNSNFIMGGNNRLAGAIDMLFSDIVGNQNLFVSAQMNGEIQDFGASVMYLNRKKPLNWGIYGSHIPIRFVSGGFFRDQNGNIINETITVDGQDFPTNYVIDQYRQFIDELGVLSQYAFSQTMRWEATASFTRFSTRLDRNYYFAESFGGFFGNLFFLDRQKLETAPGFSLWRTGTALVGDNSYFGLTAPLRGHRFRVGIDHYFGEFNFTAPTVDLRVYKQVKPFTIALRAYHYGRYGGNSEEISPLFVGSPWLVRGYNTDATQQFLQGGLNGFGGNAVIPGTGFGGSIPVSDEVLFSLLGSKMAVANLEVRLPLTGPRQLAMIKSSFLFSDLNLFFDAGMAWFDFDQLGETPGRFPSVSPLYSTGASLRVNLFGSLIIEPYYAIPLLEGAEPGFGLNLIQGW